MENFNYYRTGWLVSLGIHIIFFLIIAYNGIFSNISKNVQEPDTEIYVADISTASGDESGDTGSLNNASDDILFSQAENDSTDTENNNDQTATKMTDNNHKIVDDNSSSGKNKSTAAKISNGESSAGKGASASSGSGTNDGKSNGAGNGQGNDGKAGEGNSAETDDATARQAVVLPVPLNAPKPSYPYTMRSSGVEGIVTISFLVDGSGQVETVSVVSSSGGDAFNEAALSAARQWTFSPAQNEKGQPVICRISQTFYFKMDG